MKSSNMAGPGSKITARENARNHWKDFMNHSEEKRSICENVLHFLSGFNPDTRIFAYIGLPDEIDLIPILQKHSFQVFIPLFNSTGNMDFVLFMDKGEKKIALQKGPFGIQMPEKGSTILEDPPGRNDIVFIPSLGSNSGGYRLGRGGGYYDRWKDRMNLSYRIGILPSVLTGLNFPGENHDIIFHRVITERGIVDYI
ncbi:MAG: 5-formyltetrahydrofolate cyclo-ligase [Spirochaetia bacterium]|nr:5-formyltetrahydrofolate cyclo-ligase [Spirochaetia bacterium]